MATNTEQATTIATQYTTTQNLSIELKKIQIKLDNRCGIGGKSNEISKWLKGGYW